jgi:hypothetical protein
MQSCNVRDSLAARSVSDSLAARSVRETLSAYLTTELNDALCDPDVWMRAAETYGIAELLKPPLAAAAAATDDGVQLFGSLVIKNPHVADWFSVFCPDTGGMDAVRSALRDYSPVEAFERGVRDILGTLETSAERPDIKVSRNSADDRLVVASAALCSGIIAFKRTEALLRFLGLDESLGNISAIRQEVSR